jgi:hypothetical protein
MSGNGDRITWRRIMFTDRKDAGLQLAEKLNGRGSRTGLKKR